VTCVLFAELCESHFLHDGESWGIEPKRFVNYFENQISNCDFNNIEI